jgi:phosphatidylserine/phosphatidylglycerophosphate/cardiolipin synthase-like enzyme
LSTFKCKLRVRFVDSTPHRLHAKIYVGDTAATLGSSNFTANGLRLQLEANTRFEQASDRARYEETATVAENFWGIGEDWNEEFLALLEAMLAVVSWQEALARACADLLEGQWASAI